MVWKFALKLPRILKLKLSLIQCRYWHDSQGNRDTTKVDAVARYPFGFALENTLTQNYVTEKRYEVYQAGAVPIVWQNHNSQDYLPGGPASAIFPEDFKGDNGQPDPDKLAQFLIEHHPKTHPEAYAELHAWKADGIDADFVRQMFQSQDFLMCRICEQLSTQVHSQQ